MKQTMPQYLFDSPYGLRVVKKPSKWPSTTEST